MKAPGTLEPPRMRKPAWLRARFPQGAPVAAMKRLLGDFALHTVCEEAMCPNLGECWNHNRATIMILGGVCTRRCGFCGVTGGQASPPDPTEPIRVAAAVKAVGLSDVVITSVTRDDLADGGAAAWAETIRRIHQAVPGICVETLIPDFGGDPEALERVIEARPEILGHNIETVPSCYPAARPQASYRRSLELLERASRSGVITKTALILGLGESGDEVLAAMKDAAAAGVHILYLGQYLQPTPRHLPVRRYVSPEEFEGLRQEGFAMRFSVVVSGPLVRSSYHSDEQAAFMRGLPGKKQSFFADNSGGVC